MEVRLQDVAGDTVGSIDLVFSDFSRSHPRDRRVIANRSKGNRRQDLECRQSVRDFPSGSERAVPHLRSRSDREDLGTISELLVFAYI